MADTALNQRSESSTEVLQALRLPSQGIVYDLDPGRFAGMPLYQGHPPWQLVTYRTPRGVRNQGDQKWLEENNDANVSIMTEMLIACMHSGAHVDALAHITCGTDAHWHGGYSADEHLSDFGPMHHDASTIKPIIARGVLVDVATTLGYERLPASYPVSVEEFERALERQGTTIAPGDVVLVRTGQMSVWPDRERWNETSGAGITLPIADRLVEAGVRALGGDTETVEVMPSIVEGNPHPVHVRLLIESGVHLIECLYLEDLARDGTHEFLFIALPAKITGATASLVRPVAVV